MIETYEELMEENDETLVLKDKVRSLEERIKHQDCIIFKQRRIIRLQAEVLMDSVDISVVKKLSEEEQKIISEENQKTLKEDKQNENQRSN